jgi:hypothetical protein
MFRFTSGGGNNIFIDDINLFGTPATGINSILQDDEPVRIFPNPAANQVTIAFTLKQSVPVTLVTTDICGKEVQNKHLNFLQPGAHNVPMDISALPNGVYFLQVRSGDLVLSTQKLMVQH